VALSAIRRDGTPADPAGHSPQYEDVYLNAFSRTHVCGRGRDRAWSCPHRAQAGCPISFSRFIGKTWRRFLFADGRKNAPPL